MEIFISWSGERSRLIARQLRSWLPKVIQAVNPWMSEIDIPTGELWATEIGVHLESSDFGIICLTPENLTEPWILFEAGALSKKFGRAHVVPYLHQLTPGAVRPPLSLFQGTTADKPGTRKLLDSIQFDLGELRLHQDILDETFGAFWPNMEETLSSIPTAPDATPIPERTQADMLEELLVLARTGAETSTSPRTLISQGSPVSLFDVGETVSLNSGAYNGERVSVSSKSYDTMEGHYYYVILENGYHLRVLERGLTRLPPSS